MSSTFRYRSWWCVALGIALASWGVLRRPPAVIAEQRVAALDDDKDEDDEEAADEDDDQPDDEKTVEGKARYKVPETDSVEELQKFIDSIRDYQPRDRVNFELHRKMAIPALRAAAERILKVEKDKDSDTYKKASNLLLLIKIQSLANAKPSEQREVIDEIKKRIAVKNPSEQDLAIGIKIIEELDEVKDAKILGELYNALATALKKSDDKRLAVMGSQFEGAARRLDLVGKPMKLEGKTVEGKPFNSKTYQGKVVLVDFWATWCGPCREEIPKVKALYEKYHDRGFEVVGVNEDDEREAVDQFFVDEKLPWTTLEDTADEGKHPIAEYYGVLGLPTMILIGRDGKVVSIKARGPELQDLLTKLIGPADGDSKPSATKKKS